ncbi:MAG: VWA domain-containing protein [Burkholderiales bacterium]
MQITEGWPLVLFLAALPFVVWLAMRSMSPLSARHRGVLTVLRLIALACVTVALMQPVSVSQTSEVSVVYALDVSRSVDPTFVDAAIRWIDKANAEGKPAAARFVAFSDRARFVESAEAIRKVPLRSGPASNPEALDPLVTDLDAALDAAASGFAPDHVKRIVLMTDGVGTRGEAWRQLDRLRAQHIRVFTVPATVRAGRDAWVEGIDMPVELRRDEPAEVSVRIRSQAASAAKVTIRRAAKILAQRRVTLVAGMNRVPFTVRVAEAGAAEFSAEVQADGDDSPRNNVGTTRATVQARPRVLYVESNAESVRYLRDALTAQGFDVTATLPDGAPVDRAGFGSFDAVVLSDVKAEALGVPRMEALEKYVRDDGGGLIFAAGANAFGESGYRNSALERVLPATFEAQEKRRELALVIVLDRSYSMKGRKLDLAKAATLGALDLLEEEHRFGVVTFDSQPEITVPLAPVRSKRKAEDLISRFTASGQTNIYPALQMAYRMLVDAPAKSKHVILLSDGDTQPADFQRLAKRMADVKITVTTVAIGAEADRTLLENISTWGKGRFYYTESAERVPQIFIEETRKLVNENVREEPFRPAVKHKAEALRGIDLAQAPMLKGFASTKAKPRAEVTLTAGKDAPLLSRWQIGLGKAVVFGSDLKNRWAADWLTWPGYAKFWSQIVRESMRRTLREDVQFRVRQEAGQAVVTLDALTPDGQFRNGLAPKVSLSGVADLPSPVTLRQSGPGRYEVRVPLGDRPAGVVRASLSGGVPADVAARAGVAELAPATPEEYRLRAPDVAFLKALAEQTGGRYAPEARDVFATQGEAHGRSRALWPGFAVAALILYLLDLFLRRAPVARRWFR